MEKVDLNVIGKKLEEGFGEAKVDKYHNCATWAMAGQKILKQLGIPAYTCIGDLLYRDIINDKLAVFRLDKNDYHMVVISFIENKWKMIDFGAEYISNNKDEVINEKDSQIIIDIPDLEVVNAWEIISFWEGVQSLNGKVRWNLENKRCSYTFIVEGLEPSLSENEEEAESIMSKIDINH